MPSSVVSITKLDDDALSIKKDLVIYYKMADMELPKLLYQESKDHKD